MHTMKRKILADTSDFCLQWMIPFHLMQETDFHYSASAVGTHRCIYLVNQYSNTNIDSQPFSILTCISWLPVDSLPPSVPKDFGRFLQAK